LAVKEGFVAETSSKSEPHRRTRRDHATETAEDYVEAVADILNARETCRVTDLAKRFAVSHVTVNRIVGRLVNEGLLATEPYQPITLTAKGKRLAARCRERHEIVYRFLLAIGIDEATAAIDAEGMEHHVSSRTLHRLEQLAEEIGG
jgi:DtxR family manganese transport transcriptional regulator